MSPGDWGRIMGEEVERKPPLVRVWLLTVAVAALIGAVAILAARAI